MQLSLDKPVRRSPIPRFLMFVSLLVLALWAALPAGGPATLEVATDRPGIGTAGTELTIEAHAAGRGLRALEVDAVHSGQPSPEGTSLLALALEPAPAWAPWRDGTRQVSRTIQLGVDTIAGLRAGTLDLEIRAVRAGRGLRRDRTTREALTLSVRLTPPRIEVLRTSGATSQGGSGVVVYRVGSEALEPGGRDGVAVGDWFFPGFSLPDGAENERFVLFGVPFDRTEAREVELVAVDDLGNRASRSFLPAIRSRPPTADTIRLTDGFLDKVVSEVMAETPSLEDRGDPLANYLQLNGDLRRANAETLRALAADSAPEQLWQGAFEQLPDSVVTSSFADRRTYVYEGREVDRQVHLGFDLASTRRAPVTASNAGVVVLARYFGIYGQTVVLDHGHGLMTLYSHLSSIDVEPGQAVKKRDVLGRTGESGLAGGDHLHFTQMIGGLAVHPLEWWDSRWIVNQIERPLRGDGR